MFRRYASNLMTDKDIEKITLSLKNAFTSFGIRAYASPARTIDLGERKGNLEHQVTLIYQDSSLTNKTGKSIQPDVFFLPGGALEIIMNEMMKSPMFRKYRAVVKTVGDYTKNLPPVHYLNGKLINYFFYLDVIPRETLDPTFNPRVTELSYTESNLEPKVIQPKVIEPKVIEPKVIKPKFIEPEFIEPEVIETEVTETEFTEPSGGLIFGPRRGWMWLGGDDGKYVHTQTWNAKKRREKHITPEIEAIIDKTIPEYGTCQICGRVIKLVVSGTNNSKFGNDKGLIRRHSCWGEFELPYELSRGYLKEFISEYKKGEVEKPIDPVRLRELEARYNSWRFKDPRTTHWNVSGVRKTPVVKTPVVKTPAVKTPAVKTPVVKTPAVKKTPTVRLSPVETLFANSLSYLNADFDLDNLQPQEAIYVISELKPVTDKIPGSAKPAASKGGLPLLWVNKLIAELKELSKFYDLGDLEGDEVKIVMSSLKPILDKMPVVFTDKKASYGRYWF